MNSSRALIPLLVVAGIWNCSNPTGTPGIRGGGLPVAGASTSGGAMAQNSGGANSGGSPMGMGGKAGVGGSAVGGIGGKAMGGNLGMGGASAGVGGTVAGLGGSMGGATTGGAAMGGSSTGGVTGTVALSSGLIGYWKLDEANTTGTVMDSSGMNNHGTYMTAPMRSTAVPSALAGKSSACLTFNGTNNQVILPAVSAYSTWSATTSYSISLWVSVATFKGWVGVVANESTTSYCGLYVSDVNKFAYEANDTTGGSVAASTLMNVWHHVVILQDASNNLQRLYLDGAASANARQAQDCSNTPPVAFRFGSTDGIGGYFSGSIDDVRFYNRALNQAEIAALASGQQ